MPFFSAVIGTAAGGQDGSPEKVLQSALSRRQGGGTTEAVQNGCSVKERIVLKIDSATVRMEASRSYQTSETAMKRFVIRNIRQQEGQGELASTVGSDTANAGNENAAAEKTEGKATETKSLLQDWQTRFQAASSSVSIRSSASQTFAEIQQQTIRYIYDLFFGSRTRRVRSMLQDTAESLTRTGSGQDSFTGMTEQSGSVSSIFLSEGSVWSSSTWQGSTSFGMLQSGVMRNEIAAPTLRVLEYTQEYYSAESESTAFSTNGTVRTSDGRELNFKINIGMSRSFEQYYRENFELASFNMCDPLVINLDTDVASLEEQTFFFDIDADGEMDEISSLGAGSGYLALDKNGDGVINDGSELFGTKSGNGFADLAAYDEDGNGWIDENDAIWEKLKIWTKDENGNDVLYRLSDKGVGAICLQNAATDFTQKGQNGQTLGAIRYSGVFLYENGDAGTVQHVDVAKYSAKA